MCNTIAKPKTTKPCNSSKSCPPMWYGSSWSKVSVKETFILGTYFLSRGSYLKSDFNIWARTGTTFIPLSTKDATTNHKSSERFFWENNISHGSHIHFNNNFFVSVLVYFRLWKRNATEKRILRSQRKRNRLLKNFIAWQV